MNNLHVLVVDDEIGMRMGVQRTLANFTVNDRSANVQCSFHVTQAESAEAALVILHSQKVDILLLDHKLPGIDGMTMYGRLDDGIRLDMITIMITAYASIETAVSVTKRGIFDFLPKPFSPMELRRAVEKAAVHLILQRRSRAVEEEKRKARFDFIRVLGHELKAPIAAVEGFLSLMQQRTLGNDLDQYDVILQRSHERLGQMRRLITDLLDMTRIDSGVRRREITRCDLVALIHDLVANHKPAADTRQIDIKFELPEKLEFNIDRMEFEIIVNNLVTNAIKYNRDGGKIFIRLRCEGDMLCLEVEDTGIGMTDEEQRKLFQEFSRIRNRKTRNIMGTGLGLSILRRLVDAYHGKVEVLSQPDIGTNFKVYLKEPSVQNDGAVNQDGSENQHN